MKKPHVSYNSGNNEWYTPKEIIDLAFDVMGTINLDPATSEIANQIVKAQKIYTKEDNGLLQKWHGNIFLNPPYSAKLITQFADKVIEERKNIKQAIILVNNATETKWFNKLISVSSAVCFPSARVKFYSPAGDRAQPLQGQAILYVGEKTQRFIQHFSSIGWCAVINDKL